MFVDQVFHLFLELKAVGDVVQKMEGTKIHCDTPVAAVPDLVAPPAPPELQLSQAVALPLELEKRCK